MAIKCVCARCCGDWRNNVIIVNSFLCILGASVCGVGIGLQRALALDWQMLLNRLPVTIFSNDVPVSQPSLFEICATAIAYTGGLIIVSSLFAIFAAAFETEAVLAAYLGVCTVLFLILIAIVVCCTYYDDKIEMTVGSSMLEYISNSYVGGVELNSVCGISYSKDRNSVAFDKAMESLKCCGANHTEDFVINADNWKRNVTCYGRPFYMQVPIACCRTVQPNAIIPSENTTDTIFVDLEACLRNASSQYTETKPCVPAVKRLLRQKTMVVLTISGSTILVLVFSFLFTMCYRNKIVDSAQLSKTTDWSTATSSTQNAPLHSHRSYHSAHSAQLRRTYSAWSYPAGSMQSPPQSIRWKITKRLSPASLEFDLLEQRSPASLAGSRASHHRRRRSPASLAGSASRQRRLDGHSKKRFRITDDDKAFAASQSILAMTSALVGERRSTSPPGGQTNGGHQLCPARVAVDNASHTTSPSATRSQPNPQLKSHP